MHVDIRDGKNGPWVSVNKALASFNNSNPCLASDGLIFKVLSFNYFSFKEISFFK